MLAASLCSESQFLIFETGLFVVVTRFKLTPLHLRRQASRLHAPQEQHVVLHEDRLVGGIILHRLVPRNLTIRFPRAPVGVE